MGLHRPHRFHKPHVNPIISNRRYKPHSKHDYKFMERGLYTYAHTADFLDCI